MGNCIETNRREDDDHGGDIDRAANVATEDGGIFTKEGAMRIKIVLTREELQWLMLQLSSNKEGERRLKEALEEIERARSEKLGQDERGGGGTTTVWKPSLDSIMEVPEVIDQMNR